MIYLEKQLQIIRILRGWVLPCCSALLPIFIFFDSHTYYNMLIAFVWLGISWRWGVRLGGLSLVSHFINGEAKLFFAMPRPAYYDLTLTFVHSESFGFPSGAAQSAMVLGFLLVYGWKSRWAWPFAIFYVLIISASRILLGVHFVFDLIGGWGLGLILGGLFTVLIRPLESFAVRRSGALLSSILAVAILGLAILPAKFYPLLILAVVGSIGVFISTKYDLYLPIEQRSGCLRIFHGLIAACGVLLLSMMPNFLLIRTGLWPPL